MFDCFLIVNFFVHHNHYRVIILESIAYIDIFLIMKSLCGCFSALIKQLPLLLVWNHRTDSLIGVAIGCTHHTVKQGTFELAV